MLKSLIYKYIENIKGLSLFLLKKRQNNITLVQELIVLMKGGLDYGQYQFDFNINLFDSIHNKWRLSKQISTTSVLYRLR